MWTLALNRARKLAKTRHLRGKERTMWCELCLNSDYEIWEVFGVVCSFSDFSGSFSNFLRDFWVSFAVFNFSTNRERWRTIWNVFFVKKKDFSWIREKIAKSEGNWWRLKKFFTFLFWKGAWQRNYASWGGDQKECRHGDWETTKTTKNREDFHFLGFFLFFERKICFFDVLNIVNEDFSSGFFSGVKNNFLKLFRKINFKIFEI